MKENLLKYAVYNKLVTNLGDCEEGEPFACIMLPNDTFIGVRHLDWGREDPTPYRYTFGCLNDREYPVPSAETAPLDDLDYETFLSIWEWGVKQYEAYEAYCNRSNTPEEDGYAPVGVGYCYDGDVSVTWYRNGKAAMCAIKHAVKEAVEKAGLDISPDYTLPDYDESGYNFFVSWTERGAFVEINNDIVRWSLISAPDNINADPNENFGSADADEDETVAVQIARDADEKVSVRCTIINIGEGSSGDYDPNDPDDINFLRFDVDLWRYAEEEYEEDGWNYIGSRCTLIPATSDMEHIRECAKNIAEDVCDFIIDHPDESVDRILDKLSYLN